MPVWSCISRSESCDWHLSCNSLTRNLFYLSRSKPNQHQNKIKLDGQDTIRLSSSSSANQPAIPEEEAEESRLINGIKKLAGGSGGGGAGPKDDDENSRPPRKQSLKKSRLSSQNSASSGASSTAAITKDQDSVFKSANWLSDSELIFSLTNQVGGLVRALRVFQELDIGIKHVESRPSKRCQSEFEIFVDIDCSDSEKMRKLVHHLR